LLNFWAVPFSSSFTLIVLAYWVGCLLLDIQPVFSLFTYSRISISRCCSILAFSFFYIENTKILGFFHFWHFIFWVLIIDLSTCIEILHLIWNCRTKLKIAFENLIIYWELKLGLCILFIFIYFTC
jgi:hypothetical protein